MHGSDAASSVLLGEDGFNLSTTVHHSARALSARIDAEVRRKMRAEIGQEIWPPPVDPNWGWRHPRSAWQTYQSTSAHATDPSTDQSPAPQKPEQGWR
jgi:hypothetical protein